MRRIIIYSRLLSILFIILFSKLYSQQYTFYRQNAGYINLDLTATTLTNSDTWDDTLFNVPIGFDFSFYNTNFDILFVHSDGVIYFGKDPESIIPGDTIYKIYAFNVDMAGLGPPESVNVSPIKYQITGEAGKRIFKLEWQNAGFKNDALAQYIHFQLWLYEENNDLEIHFGPNSPVADIYDEAFNPVIGVEKSLAVSYNRAEDIFLCGTYIAEFPNSPVEYHYPPDDGLFGWPETETVFQLSYNHDIVLNNDKYLNIQLFGNVFPYGQEPGVMNTLTGAWVGHNNYKDYEWAEKFTISSSAVIKGMVSQNYGIANTTDSATYTIYSVGPDGLPGSVLTRRKIIYQCLDLTGEMNYVTFDSIITVNDSFFVSFGLNPYSEIGIDTLGLYFGIVPEVNQTDEHRVFGRTAARFFDHNWYDVYSNGYISNMLFMGQVNNTVDIIHFAIAPVVNFNLENTDIFSDSLDCKNRNDYFVSNRELILYPNYPNPAVNFTILKYRLNQSADLVVKVYNSYGQVVVHEKIDFVDFGQQEHYINTENLSTGIYMYLIQTKNSAIASEFIIQK